MLLVTVRKDFMTNIPTDLLRTLVAVVDMRSYTKAAAQLGITQPAVSAQIKRLQFLLGADIFDRRTQGVTLTARGEVVVTQARRLLSINDHILALSGGSENPDLVIRIGTPSDFVATLLPESLANFRARWPDVRFVVRTGFHEPLLRQLHNGEIDLLIALSLSPPQGARHCVELEGVWVGAESLRFDVDRPIPLISYGEGCVYRRAATQALRAAGLEWEDVFTSPSMHSLRRAAEVGLGVMPIARRRAMTAGLSILSEPPLPKLPPLFSAVHVRRGGEQTVHEELADEMTHLIHGLRSLPTLYAEGEESAA